MSFEFFLRIGNHEIAVKNGILAHRETRDGIVTLHYAEGVDLSEEKAFPCLATTIINAEGLTDSEKRRMFASASAIYKTAQRHLLASQESKR